MAGARSRKKGNGDDAGAITGTKLELTLAAERVFALHGLSGATLRQIREEAGQKNESVIHYHFGSREAIIESILHLRSKPMDEQRFALMEVARRENNGTPLSGAQISRCCLMPLAHYVLDDNEPGYYMRFLASLRSDRRAWRRFVGLHDGALNECLREMHRAKPYMPTSILDQRFVSMLYIHLNGMAAIEQIQETKGGAFRPEEGWIRVEDLIATGAAIYDAPLSPATVVAIQKAGEHHPMPSYMNVAMTRQYDGDDRLLSHFPDSD